MPRRSERTRSRKRVYTSFPGTGQGVHYKLKVGDVQRCRVCKRPIAGIPRISRFKASKLTRSEKSVARPYGGQICPGCLKRGLGQAARNI